MSTMTDEDSDLDYTKEMRKKLVSHVTGGGNKMPEETKQQMVLLQALDGIDRAALSKLKIKSDEGATTSQNAALLLAAIFNDPRTKNVGLVENTNREPPVFDINIKPTVLVEGELDLISGSDSYEAFLLRNETE